ncbi:MAG: lipocalin-like domain-containing protein [Woeseiaceae bacterium]|nr:lipocalin-like domain-containing protein [Woeseiaceae bacterium]
MRARLAGLFLAVSAIAVFAEDEPAGARRSELAELLQSDEGAAFARATAAREFVFPHDHGPHPGYRNEWWYFTGNLTDGAGRRFGFELTIFRFALAPDAPASPSAWRTNQVYIAHFAITDADGGRFLAAERFARGAVGLAGAVAEPFRVWVGDWQIAARGAPGSRERWRLSANDEDFAIALDLDALKTPVLNGVDGLSQKSAESGNASYYYSITRWDAAGTITLDGETFAVDGLAWLDREWSSSALGSDQQGWDWFALQLDDGSELMFYQLRRLDGSADPLSAGTWVAPDGRARHLARDEVDIEVTATWTSPAGGTYPAGWTLAVPSLALELAIEPVLADQELFTTVRYWEGAVDATGRQGAAPVGGRGYVELTGYADAVPAGR